MNVLPARAGPSWKLLWLLRHLRRFLIRSGIQSLLADAQAGHFDMVLSEALDRISRDQDVAGVFKRFSCFRRRGTIFTLSEGEITSFMSRSLRHHERPVPQYLAIKTHRGIRGRVEAGEIGGGNAYGYRVVHQLDARGEPIRANARSSVDLPRSSSASSASMSLEKGRNASPPI